MGQLVQKERGLWPSFLAPYNQGIPSGTKGLFRPKDSVVNRTVNSNHCSD